MPVDLVLRIKVRRFRVGDALERPSDRIPAQTILGAVVGSTVELRKGAGEDLGDVPRELIEGITLTDAFPTAVVDGSREEPLLPTPYPVRRVFEDPRRAEEVLGIDPDVERIPDPPEAMGLSTFIEALEDPENVAERIAEEDLDPVVETARAVHAAVPRTGADTTPFDQEYVFDASERRGPSVRRTVVTHVAFLSVEEDLVDVVEAALRYLRDVGIGGARTRGAGSVPVLELDRPSGVERRVFRLHREVDEGDPAVTLSACIPRGEEVEFHGGIERRGLHYARVGPYVTTYRVPRVWLAATGSYFPSWPGARDEAIDVDRRFVPAHLRDDPDYGGGFEVFVYGRGFPVRVGKGA